MDNELNQDWLESFLFYMESPRSQYVFVHCLRTTTKLCVCQVHTQVWRCELTKQHNKEKHVSTQTDSYRQPDPPSLYFTSL